MSTNNLNEQVDFTNGTSTNVPLNFPKNQIYYQTPAANTGSGTQVSDQSIGIGSIIAHSSNIIPAGYLLCNGSTFDPTQFPLLYTALGNSNTLPDMRGMFARGLDPLGKNDPDGPTRGLMSFEEGTYVMGPELSGQAWPAVLTNASIPNFYYDYATAYTGNTGALNVASPTGGASGFPAYTSKSQTANYYGPVRPKNVAVNYIIKASYVGSVVSSASLAGYLPLTGGTMSGVLTIENGTPGLDSVLFLTPNTNANAYVSAVCDGGERFQQAGMLQKNSKQYGIALADKTFTDYHEWIFDASTNSIKLPSGNNVPEISGPSPRMIIQAWHLEYLPNVTWVNFPKAYASSNPRWEITVVITPAHWDWKAEASVPFVHSDTITNNGFSMDRSQSGFNENGYNFIAIGPM